MTKYRNKKTVLDGITFDSKAEAARWQELILLAKGCYIRFLRRQVSYELAPAVMLGGRKKPALRYVADFKYFDVMKKEWVVEDVKGMVTPLFRVKQHLMATVHGIEVRLIA